MPKIGFAWMLPAGLAFAAAQVDVAPNVSGGGAISRQAEQPAPGWKQEDYASVEAVVIDARTQAPIRKAAVVLTGGRETGGARVAALSDASGRVVLERIPPGRYEISLRRNGYANYQGRAGAEGNPGSLTLSAGERLKGLVLRMTPAAVIAGRVVDEDGEPLAWARVTAMQYRWVSGRRQLVPAGGATTDDRGEYRIFGLAPGRYWVSAVWTEQELDPRPWAGARSADRLAYPEIYYPGALEPEQAAPVPVRAGEEQGGIDFRLWPVQAVTLSGRVVKPGPQGGVRDTTVMLARRTRLGRFGAAPRRFAPVDPATGRFTVTHVRPGPHLLTAIHRDGENTLYARQEIEVGAADIEGIELVLAPGITIRGRVEVEKDGAESVKLDGMRVWLQGEDSEGFLPGMNSGRVRDDGTFELRNLSPGRYSVRIVRLPEGAYLKSARLGDRDVLSSGLMLEPGSGSLTLLLSPFGGDVDGVVFDSERKPAAGATVVLVPAEDKRHREDLYFEQAADQNGRFRFRGVPPGDYRAFAWEKVEPGVWRDPAFLERYEEEGIRISVKERTLEPAELKLLPADESDR